MARSRILHALVLFTGSLDRVSGHGAVVSPPPRNAVDKDLAPWNGPVSASHGSKVPPIHFPSDFMTILNPSPICKANYLIVFWSPYRVCEGSSEPTLSGEQDRLVPRSWQGWQCVRPKWASVLVSQECPLAYQLAYRADLRSLLAQLVLERLCHRL